MTGLKQEAEKRKEGGGFIGIELGDSYVTQIDEDEERTGAGKKYDRG
jgi:hypothetical protein